ncbi:MAG: hypothetical protein ACREVK_14010 [Gammaproteobacteria bacterium]
MPGSRATPKKAGQEIFPVGLGGMGAKILLVLVTGEPQALGRPGQIGPIQKIVVFQEAHEHAAEDPVRGRLGHFLVQPRRVRAGGAARITRRPPFALQARIGLGLLADAGVQIGCERFQEALQVPEQGGAMDHGLTALTSCTISE